MNGLVKSLSRLIKIYFDELKAGGVECRVVLPAPTSAIAELLQETLRAYPLPSFLVIPQNQQSDLKKHWLKAEGVTSVRQGDMVIIVSPGEMSRIQDSVIGVGGAMRNFAFNDEWPWVESTNEHFRFEGPVLESLLLHWDIREDMKPAFRKLLVEMRDASQASHVRATVFLDEILDAFDPREPTTLSDQVERLLLHCGLPLSQNLLYDVADAVDGYLRAVEKVSAELENRISEQGGVNELLEKVPELPLEGVDLETLRQSLRRLLDALRLRGDVRQGGILTLHRCWEDVAQWKLWPLDRLQKLLDIAPTDENIKLTVEIDVAGTYGLVADTRRAAVLVEGGDAKLNIRFENLALGSIDCEIRIYSGRECICVHRCETTSESFQETIEYEHLFKSGLKLSKKSLRVILVRGELELAKAKLDFWPCCEKEPLILAVEPGFKIFQAIDLETEEAADDFEKIVLAEPAQISLVLHRLHNQVVATVEEQPVPLINRDQDKPILRFPNIIDPTLSPNGKLTISAFDGQRQIGLELEAKEIPQGEFTLEVELIKLLSRGGSAHRLKRLLRHFTGENIEAYTALGGFDESTRTRGIFARHFENEETGRPFLTNLLSTQSGQGPCLRSSELAYGDADEFPDVLLEAALKPQGASLTLAYTNARQNLLTIVRRHGNRDPRWPDYALLPIFVETKRKETEQAIAAYLTTFVEILEYLNSESEDLTWAEMFRLAYCDCVVHWAPNESSHRIIFVGPWHPLVVAKRYMTQHALTASARRQIGASVEGSSNSLALLLDKVNSVRWFASPSNEGTTTFDSVYVSATSDPGWLIGLADDVMSNNGYLSLLKSIRTIHGLETTLLPSAGKQVATGYLSDFFKAYPTRRSISVFADEAYSPMRLVESAQSFLYADEDEVSDVGKRLPGGVHIGMQGTHQIDDQDWREPPVCLYTDLDAVQARLFEDIHLISPGNVKSAKDRQQILSMPRGRGLYSAFAVPLKDIKVLPNKSLVSRSFERDADIREGGDLGAIFIQACHLFAELPDEKRIVSWQVDLPATLRQLWTVVPGNQVDPAVFVKYIANSSASGHNTSLWDYSMSLTGALNSYFVISQIPDSVSIELNKSPVLDGKPLAPAVLAELGRVGMALGSESLRSGNKALGVIGVVGAVRMLLGIGAPGDVAPPIRNAKGLRGFLLPVDSFQEILGGASNSNQLWEKQRADLFGLQAAILPSGTLGISFSAIECKYSSGGSNSKLIAGAASQAASTLRRIQELFEVARLDSGIPERLALAALISFGLRLSQEQLTGPLEESLQLEALILQAILNADYEIVEARFPTLVVVTDCNATAASAVFGQSKVVTLAKGHWPGIAESEALCKIRAELAGLFGDLFSKTTSTKLSAPATQKMENGEAAVPPNVEGEGGDDSKVTLSDAAVVGTGNSNEDYQPKGNVVEGLHRKSGEPDNKQLAPLNPLVLGTANDRPILFNPQASALPLENNNIMVTGSSGKGKTQLIKSVVAQLRRQNRKVMLLDFKNDFSNDGYFLSQNDLRALHVTFDGLPFNPLIPAPLKKPGTDQDFIAISEHINGIVDIFRRTFGLGDQQEFAVKSAVRECFRDAGIEPSGTVQLPPNFNYPDFNDVGRKLRDSNPNAYNRLDPLFDLGVFPTGSKNVGFEAMLSASFAVNLSQIQNDRIKNAVAKIIVTAAHRYFNARPHSGLLHQYFVFDEAHRVLDSEFMLQFVRECRAYGVGVLLSSQYPSDFPLDISSSLSTKLLHGNDADRDRIKDVQKLIGGSVGEEIVERLGMFDAIISNAQYKPQVIKTFGYPMYLVVEHLQKNGPSEIVGLSVEGIDPARLSLPYIVKTLREAGMVEEIDGKVHLVANVFPSP